MKTNLLKLLCTIALLGATATAKANIIWAWQFSGENYGTSSDGTLNTAVDLGPVTASGTFETEDNITSGLDPYSAYSGYLLTGIAGNVNGNAITGLLAPGDYYNDNLLQASGPLVDFNGIGFAIGTDNYNLYFDGSNFQLDDFNVTLAVPYGSFSVTVVPEPVNVALAFFGFAFVGLGVRRFFKKNARLARSYASFIP